MDTKQPDVLCLAPCPFCGGGARRSTGGNDSNAWYGTGCGADQCCPAHLRALVHRTQVEADSAWNRRAPTPASSEPVAAHTDPEGYQDGAWYWVKTNGFGGNSITAPAMYKADCGAWYSYEFVGISTRFLDVLGPCKPASDIYTAAQVQAMGRVPPGWQAVPVGPTAWMYNRLGSAFNPHFNLNDIYGRRCTVPTSVLHADGSTHGITEPMAFGQGTEAMQIFRFGKKAAGRMLDGRTWDQFPQP